MVTSRDVTPASPNGSSKKSQPTSAGPTGQAASISVPPTQVITSSPGKLGTLPQAAPPQPSASQPTLEPASKPEANSAADPLEAPPHQSLFWINLALLATLLFAIDYWLSHFTDLATFQLGPVGLLGWTVLAQLFPEAWRKGPLVRIGHNVLRRARTSAALIGAGTFFAFLASGLGALEIKSSQAQSCDVKVYPYGLTRSQRQEPIYMVSLGPQESSRHLFFTGFFARKRRLEIEVDGLPVLAHTVRGFHIPRPINVPDSFYKSPLLLIRPAEWVSGTASANPSWLSVKIGLRQLTPLKDYRGESVWIGGGGRIKIPLDLIQKWRETTKDQTYIERISTPISFAPEVTLNKGDKISLSLSRCDPQAAGCQPYAKTESKVKEEPSFPQEVYLDGT